MLADILHDAVHGAEWLLIVLSIIIIAGPLIAERLRLPGMIGLVLGGLLLGPFGLGWLPTGSLDAMGGIGLLFLMFMAGVELDLNLFERYRSAAIVFGLFTFLAPFLLSLAASLGLGLAPWAAILMGSVWASHTLVAYPAVRQAGLAGNKSVAVTVGATVITDTLALLVLAVVSGVAGAEAQANASPVWITIKLLVGLALLGAYCLFVLPRLGRWFFAGPGQDRLLRFVFIVGALSSAGLLAGLVGMEGIVGAFFAGLGLNRLIPNGGRLMERVEFFSSSLFIPAFLISVGMLINPAVLFGMNTMIIAGVFFAALAVGKYLAAWLAGRRFKFSPGEVGLMFSLTLAQAAATLAATLVGYDIGLFGDQIVNAVLLVVLISLILTSLGVQRFSGRIAPEASDLKPVGRLVMAPIIPSPALERLMNLAAGIAYADAGVVMPVAAIPEEQAVSLRQGAEELLAKAEAFAAAAAADVEGVLRIDASEPEGVIRELSERRGSLLLLEWPRGLLTSRLLAGRIDHIGTRSPVPAAAVRFGDLLPQRIVLAPGEELHSTGYQIDLDVSASIARRLAQAQNLPLVVLYSGSQTPASLSLPENTGMLQIEPGLAALQAYLQPGDLVIAPAAAMQRTMVSLAAQPQEVINQFNLLVAAGPYRLHLSSAIVGREGEAILPLGAGAS